MNKSALRSFSAWARRYLISNICDRAQFVGVTKDNVVPMQAKTEDSFMVNGVTFEFAPTSRDHFVDYVREIGWENAIEEIAYTWFNRILAIRFMEVNGYLENGINGENIYVIGSVDPDRNFPDAVDRATELKYVDKEKVYKYQDAEDNAGLFRYILMSQCAELSKWMPDVFEKVSDYTDLLLPETLLFPDGLIEHLTHDLNAVDFDISAEGNGQVEIFGWMYQFYIAEKKQEVEKSKNKINKGTLPAKTQLFTPDWIVRYMIDNTLGKIWIASHEGSCVKASLKYYLEPDRNDHNVQKIQEDLEKAYQNVSIRDIKLIDPCCGSGHILVYAFDLFYKMYLEEGYTADMIPNIILENNLYGLDVDKRAIQLTSFALTMKARSYNKTLFKQEYHYPNVIDVHETNSISENEKDTLIHLLRLTDKETSVLRDCINRYRNAEYSGSLNYGFEFAADEYASLLDKIESCRDNTDFSDIFEANIFRKHFDLLCSIVKQAVFMSSTYDCVVTNPPYLNPSACAEEMRQYAIDFYPVSKADTYAMFIERCHKYGNERGLQALVTMNGWMTISTFEKFRSAFEKDNDIISLVDMGPNGFEDISGEIVKTAAWVMSHKRSIDITGVYYDLTSFDSQESKRVAFLERKNEYKCKTDDFKKIPGCPISYNAGEAIGKLFDNDGLKTITDPRKGIVTMNDDLFIHYWFEVSLDDIVFYADNIEQFDRMGGKYAPIKTGGGFRKWYGNKFNVIKWKDNGREVKNYITEVSGDHYSRQIFNEDRFFVEGLTWNSIATKRACFRYHEKGALFGSSGPSMFPKEHMEYILALLNSKVGFRLIKLINSTQNLGPTVVGKVPLVLSDRIDEIAELARHCVELCRQDWDSYEISYDFMSHPFLKYKRTRISDAYNDWENEANGRFEELKNTEEKINELLIETYGLGSELDASVDEKDVSVRKADLITDVKSFISYAVGCIMGRYSVAKPGIIFAGGDWNSAAFDGEFKPCEYGVIPITEEQFFEEDFGTKVVDFVKVVFGEESLNENIKFIASALKPDSYEAPKKIIRDYLFNEFFEDHYQVYQHRPIYWQLDSGKSGGFRAIAYMHRYSENMLPLVRTEFIQDLRYKYEEEMQRTKSKLKGAATTAEKNAVKKEVSELDRKIIECAAYDELVNHVTSSIHNYAISLDDGVKINYAKFLSIDGDENSNILTVIKL